MRKSLCAEEEAFYELMKWAEAKPPKHEYLPDTVLQRSDSASFIAEEVNSTDNIITGSWDFELQITTTDASNLTEGTVNIIDNKTKTVIAKNIDRHIAKEICRRWNEAKDN